MRALVVLIVLSVFAIACDSGLGGEGRRSAGSTAGDGAGAVPEEASAATDTVAYGAGRTGPSAEACDTDGTEVSDASSIWGAGTFLLRGGNYGSMAVPSGATVKPYNCESVTVNGTVSLGDGSTLAGLTIEADADWVLRIDGTDIRVRNNVINGGLIEAVRILGGANHVTLVGNHIDGGREHHAVKVVGSAPAGNPDNISIRNNRFTKTYYGDPSEDLLQLEGHNRVEIIDNTFSANPSGEDGVDVKQGTDGMLMLHNLFEGGDIAGECLLVQGDHADNIVTENFFNDCSAVSLGAHPEDGLEPWWRFEENRLENSTLRVRRSRDAEILGVEMVGGTLKLGLSDEDSPRDLQLAGNKLTQVTIDNNLRHGYTCSGNVIVDSTGDPLDC